MEMIILIALMVGMFWFMTRSAKKQRQNQVEKQKAAAVPGTWVVTIGGFLGRVVSVDGDVVTLESPSGVETIWSMQAIREAYEPNFGAVGEDDVDDVPVVRDAPYDTDSAASTAEADQRDAELREADGARHPIRGENRRDGDEDLPQR